MKKWLRNKKEYFNICVIQRSDTKLGLFSLKAVPNIINHNSIINLLFNLVITKYYKITCFLYLLLSVLNCSGPLLMTLTHNQSSQTMQSQKISGNRREILQNPWKSREIQENPRKPQKILENPRKSYKILGNPRILWYIQSQKILRNPRKPWKILGNLRKSQKILKNLGNVYFLFDYSTHNRAIN